MKKYFLETVFILIVFTSNVILSQDSIQKSREIISRESLDSLYEKALKIKGVLPWQSSDIDRHENKCGFEVINRVKMNIDLFDFNKQSRLKTLLQRPVNQFSVVTPSGKFRVHYDTIGTNAIKYSLQEFMKALDSSFIYEVNFLGFPPPPNDFGEGGDFLYDVYIQDIYPLYGYTELESHLGQEKYTSFIIVDNDFLQSDYSTHGIDAARVTAAHELHHAIQLGNYIFRSDDTYFYELTSTSMEEFVFDSVNDYYAYISSFFNNVSKIFSNQNGYAIAIWNVFLQKEFGNSIFLKQWEYMKTYPALKCIQKSIEDEGSTFRSEFSKFFLYNYFTGQRSIPEKYYEEGANYPLIKMHYSFDYKPPTKVITGLSQPVSAHFYQVVDSVLKLPAKPDTITIIIVNSNVDSALVWSASPKTFGYTYRIIDGTGDDSFKKLSQNLYGRLEVADIQNWKDQIVLNDTSAPPVIKKFASDNLSFPMPFRYSKHSLIKIPINEKMPNEVDLNIYNSSMDLVYSEKKILQLFEDMIVITWNGLDSKGKRLSTGVYFYVVADGESTLIGKILIVND